MAYDTKLADRVRLYLNRNQKNAIEEKKMFAGLAFMINGKMCINVSGEKLMCRFDPAQTEDVAEKDGFSPMIMKGRNYKGYCYVEPAGFNNEKDFEFWMNLCLSFNEMAKSSKKNKSN